MDKTKLLEYLGYDTNNQNENYLLYTDDALNLLIHGFLSFELPDSIKENLKEKFNKYWR